MSYPENIIQNMVEDTGYPHSILRRAAYLDENFSNANRGDELRLEDDEFDGEVVHRIHDEEYLKPGWSDQSRDPSQE